MKSLKSFVSMGVLVAAVVVGTLTGCVNVTVNPTATSATPPPTTTAAPATSSSQTVDATQQEVDAANTELQNIKTAILAYYSGGGVWPQNTTVLGKYLAGPVHQNYNVDTQDGYIVSLYGAQGWPGIVFHPGVAGAGGRDGFWAKN